MIDLTSLVAIAVIIVVIYFFLKLIVSPLIRVILGIVIFIIALYLLQRFFGFDVNKVLSPFGISVPSDWIVDIGTIFGPFNYYIEQIKSFASFLWGNIPKSLNQ